MAFQGQHLEQRQGQSLVMTPQLQQAIKLLQLSNLELTEFVEAELEKNPLLVNGEPDSSDRETSMEANEGAEPASGTSELEFSTEGVSETAGAEIDADFESLHPETAPSEAPMEARDVGGDVNWRQTGSGAGGDSEGRSAIDLASAELSLADFVRNQMFVALHDPIDRLLGAAMIDEMDDDGYLRRDTNEIAGRLGADQARAERVLSILQGCEPTGVLARDLQECLALQLKERDRYDPAMAALVDNLALLAAHDYRGLERACGVDADDMTDMIGELRALTPKPGLSYGGGEASPVEPDVFVRETPSGGWAVELNVDTLPRVLVDTRYYAEVSKVARSEADKSFISSCHQNANWLVKSLDQRARTILKVAGEIVRQQDAFFAYGVEHLRPLNLKTVADAIEMHESTVSRVTTNKYMATPRGLFELKYFFTAAIPSSGGGEAHSSEAVRHRIKALIEKETPDAVLSDDRIVELLSDVGVEIARRTVAKYREAMNIPSSVQRRRMLRRAR